MSMVAFSWKYERKTISAVILKKNIKAIITFEDAVSLNIFCFNGSLFVVQNLEA